MISSISTIVTAHNEAESIGETIAALQSVFPQCRLIVADDASTDTTASVARARGAQVISQPVRLGKGGATTTAASWLLGDGGLPEDSVVLLCDADLGSSASQLSELVRTVQRGDADLAVANFTRKQGGGFGIAVGYARRAVRRRTGIELNAPICGQRAMRVDLLKQVLPFADGFGIEVGMTLDALRAGFRITEVNLDLDHASTGRNLRGFIHRARQLADFVRAVRTRRK